MVDRDPLFSKHQQIPTARRRTISQRCYVTSALTVFMTALLLSQLLGGRGFSPQWLALSWHETILSFKLWQCLTYPFSVPASEFQSLFHRILFACEWLIPMFILIAFGTQIERAIGWQRTLLGFFLMTLFSALIALVLIRCCPALGSHVSGPIAFGLGLLSFYLFLFPERHSLHVIPTSLTFLVLSSLMILIVVIDVLAYKVAGQIAERNQLALLPGVLCGGSVLYFDKFFKRARQRHRDRREVALVLEEVDSRARVEQLLSKISQTGMGSLTHAEKTFLRSASRFYHPDCSQKE
jgi:hypothetical protein